jgi:anti-sigma factor RsiW
MSDPITEADLLAYVDDQLDPARRIEVEEHLAQNPDAATRVMADLKDRDTLRLIHAAPLPRPAEPILVAATRLERALAWRELGLKLRRIAAVVTLIGFGWFAHGQVGLGITDSEASPKPPAFVEDALHSHETALVRARMASQRETAEYDPAEILAETGTQLPPCRRAGRSVTRRSSRPVMATASRSLSMPGISAGCPCLLPMYQSSTSSTPLSPASTERRPSTGRRANLPTR